MPFGRHRGARRREVGQDRLVVVVAAGIRGRHIAPDDVEDPADGDLAAAQLLQRGAQRRAEQLRHEGAVGLQRDFDRRSDRRGDRGRLGGEAGRFDPHHVGAGPQPGDDEIGARRHRRHRFIGDAIVARGGHARVGDAGVLDHHVHARGLGRVQYCVSAVTPPTIAFQPSAVTGSPGLTVVCGGTLIGIRIVSSIPTRPGRPTARCPIPGLRSRRPDSPRKSSRRGRAPSDRPGTSRRRARRPAGTG